jgi:hypothetical protein
MKIIQLLMLGFAISFSSAFSADLSTVEASQGSYMLSQNTAQNRDGVIDPGTRRDLSRQQTPDSKSNRDQSSSNAATSSTSTKGVKLCQGEFAFCASSTCEKTGRTIKVKENDGKTTREYPEVSCKCPIIDQKIAVEQNGVPLVGIAAVNEGNMNGACTPPSPGTIWSYFSKDITLYPQESANPAFSTPGPAQAQTCPASSGTGSNCWDYLCKIDPKLTNGVRTATCLCPYGEGLFGDKARKSSDFVTYAGAYSSNPSAACSQYPVGYPLQLRQ